MPDRPYTGTILYDAKDPGAKFPPIEPLRPPARAPNVLVILLDDVGFGATSAFGGPCVTRTAERLAAGGLTYTRFHTTALCSPTRAALLTGRNHHSVGMGVITEMATAAPGYTTAIPNTAANIGKILSLNGYGTGYFGKCHEVPVWESSAAGPFDRWPTRNGFDRFYGFVGGETSQWFPEIYDGTRRARVPDDPEYHFMADMTDQAIGWIQTTKSISPERPFFAYFAPGACHAPHHVPKAWADRYKGLFDDGWYELRERIFERQKQLGVIPASTTLTPRPAQIPAWEHMPKELLPVLAREMEVYAGFLEYTDHHVGRLVDALAALGVLEDTLILYLLGDNGASAEGTLQGTFNEMINFNGMGALETPQFLMDHIDELGGRASYNHYAVGWAHALDTPYQWTKQVASHWGGTRNGMIVHWPGGIAARGEIRPQFHHVIDVAPTILEATGIREPVSVEGVQQMPMEGVSMLYTFDDPCAEDRHRTQYFEMFGNRGIYHEGFTAVTRHRTPWILVGGTLPQFDDDVWELYDTTKDWSQSEDLSKQMPDKLHELQRLWLVEAARHNVLPLDDRTAARLVAETAGRPDLVHGTSQVLFDGMEVVPEAVLDIKNKSHSITADVEIPDSGARGVIFAQGTQFGGYALYAPQGRLKYVYNFLGLEQFTVEANDPLPAGQHRIHMEFAYDGGGAGQGGTVTLLVDGAEVARGRVERTHPVVFSTDAIAAVGDKRGSPISGDLAVSGNRFSGKVERVQIDLGLDAGDHPTSGEDRLRVALAIQ